MIGIFNIQDDNPYLQTFHFALSLSKIYNDCFGSVPRLEGDLYVIATDNSFANVIAAVNVWYNVKEIPTQFQLPYSVILYNVCTASQFRGQGYMKTLLTTTLNDLASKGIQNVYLHVLQNNIPALRLYQSLGFEIIYSTAGSEPTYIPTHTMLLQLIPPFTSYY